MLMRVAERRNGLKVERGEDLDAGAIRDKLRVFRDAAALLRRVPRKENDDRVQIGARKPADPMLGSVQAGVAEHLRPGRHAVLELLGKRRERGLVQSERAQAVPRESRRHPALVAVDGHRDLVTVVGHAAIISAGEWITASGQWINDRAHGQQFKARFLKTSAPSSIDGIEKYLGSGMIRGIGPVYAKKMIKAFGDKVFDVIEAEPGRLREVTGIGAVRAKRITDAWAEQKIVREIMVFLHSNGVGTARAVRIFKTYGADAVQVMTENPYRLARDIRGIGFKSADAIAMRLGIEKTAMIRLRAGISYALTEAMDEGHCGLPTDQLIPLAEELLEAPKELILTALELERSEGAVIADKVGETACMFLAGLYRAEQTIADRLIRIVNGRLPWTWIDEAKAVPWVEKRSGLQLADSQRAAIRLALMAKALVITGGPGVGKTTIVNSIIKISRGQRCAAVALRPHGSGGEAHDRSDGRRGQDDPPALRSRSQERRFQTQRWQSPRVRSARRRRGLDGRCHADASADESDP